MSGPGDHTDPAALPPSPEESVVDIRVKDVLIGVGCVLGGTVLITVGWLLLRDHLQRKRMEALMQYGERLAGMVGTFADCEVQDA